jgi:hypothetical protein
MGAKLLYSHFFPYLPRVGDNSHFPAYPGKGEHGYWGEMVRNAVWNFRLG